MSSIDALVAAIDAARVRIDESSANVAQSIDNAEKLLQLCQRLGVTDKANAVGAIKRELEAHQAQLGALKDQADEARAQAEALRGDGGSGGGGTPPGSPPIPSAEPPPPERPFKPMRTDPEKAREVQPYVGEPIAYATLWDDQGRQLVGVHNADGDGPAKDADWHEPWGSYARLRRHVESHAAARMHRDGHRQLAMYINMKPCSYPDGCEANLRDLLPEGTTLWVHQVRRSGTTIVTQYRGTGRAINGDD